MTPLAALIADIIRAHGPIDIGRFMTLVSSHRTEGYYRTRDPFGKGGDFVTAPEISQVFGELLGLFLADYWIKLGRPNSINLVELGPGRGTLLADMLRSTRSVEGFHQSLCLHLIEINPALQKQQESSIEFEARHAQQTAKWHGSIDDLEPDMPLFLLANEFVDVLPIRQFTRVEKGWRERRIGLSETDQFAFVVDGRSLPSTYWDRLEAPLGAILEISPARESLVQSVALHLIDAGGIALFIDYAHEAGPNMRAGVGALGDTFQAISRNERVSPLTHVGEADLTARVDFERLVEVASEIGVDCSGPVTQSQFLDHLGIEVRRSQLLEANPDRASEINTSINRLINPQEMGTLFKVMALSQPDSPEPSGFSGTSLQ